MYSLEFTRQFKKDLKLCDKRNYEISLFEEGIEVLSADGKLPLKFKPHILKGNYKNYWECHIKPDWIIIWQQDDEAKEIVLVRRGRHSDFF